MIYYSDDRINVWNYGNDNLIKVYRDGYVAYYKVISGSSSGQTPCYAVTDDINEYSNLEFVDVFDKATSKWYKLNNLNEFEEYGVYANTTGGTYYEGKLAIVGSTSRLPNGYTEVEYVENTGSSSVNLNLALNESTSNTYEIVFDNTMEWTSGGENLQTFLTCQKEISPYPGWSYRFDNSGAFAFANNIAGVSLDKTVSGTVYHNVITCTSLIAANTSDYPLNLFSGLDSTKAPFRYCKGRLYNMQVTLNNSLVRNLVPCKRNSDNEYGLYDLVNDVFYASATNAKLSGGAALPTNADEYEYSGGSWVNVGAVSGGAIPDSTVIEFEDANVKALCVNAWGGNVVAGELTYGEAKQVTSLGTVFKGQTSIQKFNEFCYFTGMQSVNHADFSGCTNLKEIVIPTSVTLIYGTTSENNIPFSGCPNLSAITYLASPSAITIGQTSRESDYYRQQSHSGTPMVYPNREIIAMSHMFGWKNYMANVYFQSPTPPTDINQITNLSGEPYNCRTVYCPVGAYQAYAPYFVTVANKTVIEYDFDSDPNNVLAREKTWSGKTIGDAVYPVYYAAKQAPPIVVDFQTTDEMEAYECPYVGLVGYVSTDRYVFADNYEWVMSAQTPCYAVTDDITQYSSTEFEDVFDKTTSKWYKLNNLNQFEEYGVYANTTGGTYYEGKLAIDDGYEYVYSGSSWVNVGQTSGTTVTIQSPEYLQRDADHKGAIMSDKKFGQNSKIQLKLQPTNGNGGALFGDYGTSDNNDIRFFFAGSNAYWDLINKRLSPRLYTGTTYELELGNHYIKNLSTSTIITSGTSVSFAERDCALNVFGGGVNAECIPQAGGDYGLLYYFKLYDSDTLVLDMIPYADAEGYGLFDKVSLTKYPQSPLHASLTASTNVQTITLSGGTAYPMYYAEKQDPPSEVTFATMDEALAYECPYVGLKASIGGNPYVFNAQYQWVPVT